MHAARTALSASALVAVTAGLLAAPASADVAPQVEVCRGYTNGTLVTAGQAWTGYPPAAVPGKLSLSVARSGTFYPSPGGTLDITVDWRNTATGQRGTVHEVAHLSNGGGSHWWPAVPTGAGRIELTMRSTANVVIPLFGGCSGSFTVQ